jgi:hypothetical protein
VAWQERHNGFRAAPSRWNIRTNGTVYVRRLRGCGAAGLALVSLSPLTPKASSWAAAASATRCFEALHSGNFGSGLCYDCAMSNIIDRILDSKGVGWSLLRFSLIVSPAIVALVILNMFFRLD